MQAIPSVRAAVAHVAHSVGATQWGEAGQAPGAADVSAISSRDVVRILPIVALVLALLLGLLLRSLIAPLYLVASVVLSYTASLGLAVVIFVTIGGQLGINFTLPFFMFVFIMALGEDYNILVMSRIKEESAGLPPREWRFPRAARDDGDNSNDGGTDSLRYVRSARCHDQRAGATDRHGLGARYTSSTRSWCERCSYRRPWCSSVPGIGGRSDHGPGARPARSRNTRCPDTTRPTQGMTLGHVAGPFGACTRIRDSGVIGSPAEGCHPKLGGRELGHAALEGNRSSETQPAACPAR